MNSLSINQKLIISAVVGFVVGVGAVFVWNMVRQELASEKTTVEEEGMMEESETTEDSGVMTSPILIGSTGRVDVDDQRAGSKVQITSVTLDQPGWVAIHEDRDGKLGNILGAHWFPAGTSNGSVTLLRDTVVNGTYYAALYNDNGDKAFEFGVDAQMVGENQQPLIDVFHTPENAQ